MSTSRTIVCSMTYSIFYYHWLLSETPECQRWGIWCWYPSACKRVVGWEEFTIWIPKFQFPKLSTSRDWPAYLPLQNPNLLQEFTTISSPRLCISQRLGPEVTTPWNQPHLSHSLPRRAWHPLSADLRTLSIARVFQPLQWEVALPSLGFSKGLAA